MTIREIDQQLVKLDVLERRLRLDLVQIEQKRQVFKRAKAQLVKRTQDIDKEEAKKVQGNRHNMKDGDE